MVQPITAKDIQQFKADFKATPQSNTIKNAIMNNGFLATSANTDSKAKMAPVFFNRLRYRCRFQSKAIWSLLDVRRVKYNAPQPPRPIQN